jgi:hypothetical protein
LKPLFGHVREAATVEPEVTAPAPSPAAPASSPPPGAAPDVEGKLFNATERVALRLMERSEELLKGENPDIKVLMQALSMGQDWLVRRSKLKPESTEAEDEAVSSLKAMLDDPAKVVERLHGVPAFQKAMRAKGWLPPPEKINHRPNKEQAAERAEYARRGRIEENETPAAEDDSELQRMLRSGVK